MINYKYLFLSPLCANEARWVYNLDERKMPPNTTLIIQNALADYNNYEGTLRAGYNDTQEEYACKRGMLIKTVRRLFPGWVNY
jgi:hypothetical protein